MEPPLPVTASGPDSDSRTPRVAVIVPAYGVAHLLGEAIESVLAQTLTDWECIVIDDGAPDDVAGAVAPYLTDPRIRFVETANFGLAAARNNAIAASTAPLISLLDGDDRFRPTYLEDMTTVLENEPDARLVTCNAFVFGEVRHVHNAVERKQGSGDGERGTLGDVLDRSFNVYIGTTFRRADFDRVGGFDESFRQCEDLDLWIRLMQLGGYARYVDKVLGEYRVRGNSLSSNVQKMLSGSISAYEKAAEALGDNPDGDIARRMAADKRETLAFEQTIDRIIGGDTVHGLAELRAAKERISGLSWRVFLLIWRIFPSLAAPILRARRLAHALNRVSNGERLRQTLMTFRKRQAN